VVSFTPGERAPGTHWIGGWVDPRASLDDVEKRLFLTLSGLELQPILGRPARSQSAVKKVEFISDRMSYIILRCRWCKIIVLNVHAPTEDKIDDMKDRFYEELEQVFDKFPRYHMKILLGDFNAKVGSEDVFKPTTGNESLHEISNDNGVRVVKFATSKNLTVKSTMFPQRNIHKVRDLVATVM
jgi:hypothetical protein